MGSTPFERIAGGFVKSYINIARTYNLRETLKPLTP
jgi:hypothetical protein